MNCQIFGRKIIKPTMAAKKAVSKTAPAAMSFTCPILLFWSGETISLNNSTAELNPSAERTIPIAKKTKHHCSELMLKSKPKAITTKAIKR